MTDLPTSMAVFLRELYALYIAFVFHSRVSKLILFKQYIMVAYINQNFILALVSDLADKCSFVSPTITDSVNTVIFTYACAMTLQH